MKIPNASVDILDNGIKIVTEELPHLRSASMGILVGAGSASEQKDIMGISHFIEHMNFKGTKKRSAFEIAQALDSIGGKLNAFTGKEFTVYYAVVEDKHFDIASDVLSDMFLNSLYDPKEMELEKNVVFEEIKMYEDTPDEQIHDIFLSTILKGHNLGNITLGEEKTVQGIDRNKIKRYMKDLYAPDNMIISVAGNIDRNAVVDSVKNAFSSFSGKRSVSSAPIPPIEKNFRLKTKKTEQAHLLMGTKGSSQFDPDKYSFAVLDNALGGAMSSRLFQEIREKRGLVYSIYSYNQGFKDTGVFGIYAGAKKENLQQVIELILKELADIKKNGLKPEELSRSKEYIKGSMVLALESSNSRMSYIAKSTFYYDRIITIDEVIEKIDAVTGDDIVRLAEERFRSDLMNLVAIGDMKSLPVNEIII